VHNQVWKKQTEKVIKDMKMCDMILPNREETPQLEIGQKETKSMRTERHKRNYKVLLKHSPIKNQVLDSPNKKIWDHATEKEIFRSVNN
jgi:hypothetical protein